MSKCLYDSPGLKPTQKVGYLIYAKGKCDSLSKKVNQNQPEAIAVTSDQTREPGV